MIPDAHGLERWLRARAGFELAAIRTLEAVEGGASNLTYRVDLSSAPFAAVALRLQRDEGILAPYDVAREGEVLRCLQHSRIPVPQLAGIERDPSVLGAPFIVMEWIDAPHMGVSGAPVSFAAYAATVASIHAIDWRALRLDFLGVPDSAAAATASELDGIAARMARFDCDRDPLLMRALATLRTTIPSDGRLAFCQGDINVYNYLVRDGAIVAVVDWEMARIGDPRADVGQILALGHLRAGTPFVPAADLPFVRAYEQASGRPLTAMNYFRARWLFELGVIYHGWMKFNDFEPWYSWDHLAGLLSSALAELA